MQRVEDRSGVAPGQMGGYKPKTVSGDHAVWLNGSRMAISHSGSLPNLPDAAVWDFVHAEKLSFKKSR
ncbi:hypothetical protein [Bradyrhizobium sp. 144]|uniref:hypothetical protein n=1 Tax=Bradyrhizobium sp. 144 TaxID=2782620 RepID=UPI001FFAD741|nr:hypothetical protein [Bradyrhizobium sp. 144]MCK1695085.1 hypothetical protein [Bradyrhizobium sp. 144]